MVPVWCKKLKRVLGELSLNSLKGGHIGSSIGVIQGDTRSLDCGSLMAIHHDELLS